jgi:hypothetical protein
MYSIAATININKKENTNCQLAIRETAVAPPQPYSKSQLQNKIKRINLNKKKKTMLKLIPYNISNIYENIYQNYC